jgi:hypothetical protein
MALPSAFPTGILLLDKVTSLPPIKLLTPVAWSEKLSVEASLLVILPDALLKDTCVEYTRPPSNIVY